MLAVDVELLIAAIRAKGFVVFDSGDYDLNLFGVRATDTAPNEFDDVVGVFYRADSRWVMFALPATTDPGAYWREHPMSVDGTAILKPGQHRGAYMVGTHKGYPALQQRQPLPVYRDANRDAQLDLDASTVQVGMFGINIHRAGATHASTQVNRWSAGCQVVADPMHFDLLMALATKSIAIHGNALTYTLLDESDL